MSKKTRLFVVAGLGAAAAVAVGSAVRAKRRITWAGRAVLVTGGSRGLGLLLARRLSAAGADVAICARDVAEMERVKAELPNVTTIQCDVGDPDQIRSTVDRVARQFGRLDALFNNAGIIQVGPLAEMTTEDFEQAMRVNFWAAYHGSQAAIPHFKAAGSGRIVNIASIGGKVPVPHLVPYTASKFALVGLSEAMRIELIPHRIYVTTVCPGLITTGSPRNALFKGKAEDEYAWFAAGDAMPPQAMDADRQAELILTAAADGDAELIRPVIASLQSKIHGLMPGVTQEVLSVAARLLPKPGGVGRRAVKGREVDSKEPRLTHASNEAAAGRNNE